MDFPGWCCMYTVVATTVLSLFKQAVIEYGLPSRVCTDQGLENIEVAKLMLVEQGCDRGSVLVGASVHNQRIERLERCVCSSFPNCIIVFLIAWKLLDPLDSVHLYALHFVFLPRINKASHPGSGKYVQPLFGQLPTPERRLPQKRF